MKAKRAKLVVRVDLNPDPGNFYTISSARDNVARILSNAIPDNNPLVSVKAEKKKTGRGKNDAYTVKSFLLDLLWVCLTGGLWFIWIFVREMRRR